MAWADAATLIAMIDQASTCGQSTSHQRHAVEMNVSILSIL
jgi:hypothetical protein